MRGMERRVERERGGHWGSEELVSLGSQRLNGRITCSREKGEERWRDQGERVRSGHS